MNKIYKSFNKNIVLDNIEFELSNCTLILGENGSGKTTLLKILSGITKKYEGSNEIGNESSTLLDSSSLFFFKTGLENLDYFLDKEELANSNKYINLLKMDNYINKRVFKYSNGMKKKLGLVIALSRNKKYLLLDEPTNSLDIESVELLKNILNEEKKNRKVIIASHDIKIFDDELIDSIFLIKNTKLYQKNVSEFKYTFYKVKTLDEIANSDFEYELENGYQIFKVNNDELERFSELVSKYRVIEMIKIDYFDQRYMEGIYND